MDSARWLMVTPGRRRRRQGAPSARAGPMKASPRSKRAIEAARIAGSRRTPRTYRPAPCGQECALRVRIAPGGGGLRARRRAAGWTSARPGRTRLGTRSRPRGVAPRALRRASEVVRDGRALLRRHRRAPPLRWFLGRGRRALLRRRGPRRRRRSGFSSGFAASAHGALQESGFGALVVIRAGWTRPRCDFCHGSDASIERSQCVRSAVGL